MKNKLKTPSKIRKFNKALKMLGSERKAVFGLKRFFARYGLAYAYEGMNISILKAATVRGYSSMYGLQIAYTAFDALLEGIKIFDIRTDIKTKAHQHKISDAKLAEIIRKDCKDLLDIALMHCDEKLRKNLLQFIEKKNENILFVISAVRHIVSHGFLSVHGGGLDSKKRVQVMASLKNAILMYSDEVFSDFTDQVYDHAASQIGFDEVHSNHPAK